MQSNNRNICVTTLMHYCQEALKITWKILEKRFEIKEFNLESCSNSEMSKKFSFQQCTDLCKREKVSSFQ